jgi:hypothetical protein
MFWTPTLIIAALSSKNELEIKANGAMLVRKSRQGRERVKVEQA